MVNIFISTTFQFVCDLFPNRKLSFHILGDRNHLKFYVVVYQFVAYTMYTLIIIPHKTTRVHCSRSVERNVAEITFYLRVRDCAEDGDKFQNLSAGHRRVGCELFSVYGQNASNRQRVSREPATPSRFIFYAHTR